MFGVDVMVERYEALAAGRDAILKIDVQGAAVVKQKVPEALLVFLVVIALYLTFRFEWRMALAAIIAVVHDIIITVGVYAVTGFEVTPATVIGR